MPSKSGGPSKGGGGNQIPPSVSAIFNHGLWVLTPHACFDGVDIDSEPKSLGRTRNQLTNSANRPQPRLAFNAPFGGYSTFTAADTTYYSIGTDVADAVSELFVCALIRRRDGATNQGVLTRGNSATGSMALYMDDTQVQMGVNTTSGGEADRVINVAVATLHSRWYLLMGAYKSGSYVKVGLNGVWLGETTFTATGLRTSAAYGLRIGEGRETYFDGDIAMVGIGTAIPTDQQLMALNVGIQGAIEPPNPGIDPFIDPSAGGGAHRLLLLGAG